MDVVPKAYTLWAEPLLSQQASSLLEKISQYDVAGSFLT